jgi:hypothetical protein
MLLAKPMVAWRIPRWALPAAIGGVLAIAGADAILMQHRPVSVRPRAIAEKIGLRADAEGEGLRVQWDRGSRPVRNADHAILFIEDGANRSQLDLTGRQLDSSSVMYWPESERGAFRLEVYRGSLSSSEAAAFALPPDRRRRRPAGPARAMVRAARPSPFEHLAPEVTQTEPAPARPIAPKPAEAVSVSVDVAEPASESRLDRFISRIPLLRRWRTRPAADGSEPR